jgi:putative transcriptional regulator
LGIAGSLLIAHPNLLDPNFRRTILLLPLHDPEEGSFGLVLNRPTDKTVADFLPEEELGRVGDVPVFIGGPVSPEQMSFVALQWRNNSLECKLNLEADEVLELLDQKDVSVRAFVGYSGWGKGQLEEELKQKAWVVQKPDRDLLDVDKCAMLWKQIMSEQGAWFRLLAEAPDDPSLN